MNKFKKNSKLGVSGLMRVKNERGFIKPCIESCIDALDELIIVYNDCSDGSEVEIENMRKLYPSKIKVFEYPFKIYGVNLTKEEYEYAKTLPSDSPNLFCNYNNFVLSKATYSHALLIDADQIYFRDVLKKYCDICRTQNNNSSKRDIFIGRIAQFHLSLYRYLSLKTNRVLPIIPSWIAKFYSKYYKQFAISEFLKDKACLSFSGVNVFHKKNKTLVSMGLKTNSFNILPPFNGEGDHVLFKISEKTYYSPFDMHYYRDQRNMSYCLIEILEHPYKSMPVDFMWFHLNADRKQYREKVSDIERFYPEAFEDLNKFVGLSYSQILKRADFRMFNIFQRILFGFVYKAYNDNIKRNHDKAKPE